MGWLEKHRHSGNNMRKNPLFGPDFEKARELRESVGLIDLRLEDMSDEETRPYLLGLAKTFAPIKASSESRNDLVMHVLDEYAATFEDPREGYLDIFIQTDCFPGSVSLPLDYVVDRFELPLLSRRYIESEKHVSVLLKRFSVKEIVDAYAERKRKLEVLKAFKGLGYSLADLKREGVRINKDIEESLG